MKPEFKDKVALVTGGSFGIGRATAKAFARQGAKVVIADWIENQETLNSIREEGGEAVFIKCDVSSEDDVQHLIQETIKTYGKLDFAFNNAGVEGEPHVTAECTSENWDRTINVNLKGIWLCMKYELPHMLRQGKGAIVNNASIAGLVGFVGLPAYVASKHGVVGLTKTTALEYVKEGIRVNTVCPGVIETPMIDRFTQNESEARQQLIDQEPIGRMGAPEEIASAVLYLCSDEASYVTGISMPVDGGWVAQ